MTRARKNTLFALLLVALAAGWTMMRFSHVLFARALPLEFDDCGCEPVSRSWTTYSTEYLETATGSEPSPHDRPAAAPVTT